MGTIATFCTFIGVLFLFTKEIAWIVNYTLLLTILGWMMYMQLEMTEMKQRIGTVETGVAELQRRPSRGR